MVLYRLMLFKVSNFCYLLKNEQEGHTLHMYILEIRSKYVSLCGAHGCVGGGRDYVHIITADGAYFCAGEVGLHKYDLEVRFQKIVHPTPLTFPLMLNHFY